MYSKFHKKNFYVVPIDRRDVDVMMILPSFFPSLRYVNIDEYAILYEKSLDPKDCLKRYLDYGIQYYEDVLSSVLNKTPDSFEFCTTFPEIVDGYKIELTKFREARREIELLK